MSYMTFLSIFLGAYGFNQIEGRAAVLLRQDDYDNITLTCSYTMADKVRGFRWMMDRTVVGTYWSRDCLSAGTVQKTAYSVTCEGGTSTTLVIKPKSIEESMHEWTCGIDTDSTDDYIYSDRMMLSVSPRVAPLVKLETNIRVQKKDPAVLRIDVLSNPAPVFSWSKLTDTDEWTPVGQLKHMTVVSKGLQSILTIPRVRPQDTGTYKVVASNDYGQPFEHEYEVHLEGDNGSRSSKKTSGTTTLIICGLVGACLVSVAVGLSIKCYRSKHKPRPVVPQPNIPTLTPVLLHCRTFDVSGPQTSRTNCSNDCASSTEDGAQEYEQAATADTADHIYTDLEEQGEGDNSSSLKTSSVNKSTIQAANKNRTTNENHSMPDGASSTEEWANEYEVTDRDNMSERVYTGLRKTD